MKEIIKNDFSISKPSELTSMAIILKNHIVKNKLYVPIAGRNYIMVEGWQFAGGLLGLLPRIKEVKNVSDGTKIKWQAEAEIVDTRTGQVVGSGMALCSNTEGKKKSFDEYAVLSMAQTRAIGKAYRNLIGWIMKMAGYESTPAEEVANGMVSHETTLKMQKQANNEHLGEDIDPKPSIAKLKKAKTQSELRKIWQSLSATERLNPDVIDFKDNLKTQIK